MKTALIKEILDRANKLKSELDSEYLSIEHIYLSTLITVSEYVGNESSMDNSLVEEFEQLKEHFKLLPKSSDINNLKEQIANMKFTNDNAVEVRNLSVWIQFSAKQAGDLLDKLVSNDRINNMDKFVKTAKEEVPLTKVPNISREKPEIKEEDKEEDSIATNDSEDLTPECTLTEVLRNSTRLREKLSSNVLGQNHVIKAFVEGYFQGEVGYNTDASKHGPKSLFLFAGSPGTGKTFLAETAAKALELPFKRFDMSAYSSYDSVDELVGYGKNYKSPSKGELTGFVHDNKKCILLFDEIEKANRKVIHLFLQMLDAGRVYDNLLEENVMFDESIVIFTTNAGKQLYQDSTQENLSLIPKSVILKALEKDIDETTGVPFFPPAICSRFATGNVLLYNHLSANNLIKITRKELLKQQESFEKVYELSSKGCEELASTILFSVGGKADGRTVVARAKQFFFREIFELLRLMDNGEEDGPVSKVKSIKWTVDVDSTSDEVKRLYFNQDETVVLVFGDEAVANNANMKDSACKVFFAKDYEQAAEVLQKNEVTFALIDYKYKPLGDQKYLNVEDVNSEGRRLFTLLSDEYKETPIYLLEMDGARYSEEEKISFYGRGVRDFVQFGPETSFSFEIEKISRIITYQMGLSSLALRNQVLTYETAQMLNKDGTEAHIKLFDLRLVQAVDAEDQKVLLSADEKPIIHWDDIIVSNDVKDELQYFVKYLQNPKAFIAKGTRAPKGIMLYGPPGTGKTTLAKVMATEADVTFLAVTADQFIKKWAGEGPEAVHQIFATARKYAPAILFIDEIDAIGKKRGEETDHSGVHEILNALLTEMDGFKTVVKRPVFVMAATNLGGNNGDTKGLDPALVRRFDRSVLIDLPDKECRLKYLHMLKNRNSIIQISEEEMENIAIRSMGMSPALIEAATELAIRNAIRADGVVDDKCFDEAFETYNNGEEKHWDESELLRTARHEAGHAFVCNYFGEKPSYLTIVARDDHGGYMLHGDTEKKGVYKKDDLLNRICVSLAGRAAEVVYYDEIDGITTGPSSDLQNATNIAKSMICSYGMYPETGLATVDARRGMSDELDARVHELTNKILGEQMERAMLIIRENINRMDNLVSELMDKTHLTESQIQDAIK